MMYEQQNDMSDLDLLTPDDTPRRDHKMAPTRFQSGDTRLNDSGPQSVLGDSLIPEYDHVINRYKLLSQDQGKVEKEYLKLCQFVQHQQKQWQQQRYQIKFVEKENSQLTKELNATKNKLKSSTLEVEAKVQRCLAMEKQLEEMHEAFDLMSEIVFDDDGDVSAPRRAQIAEIQNSFKRNVKADYDSEASTLGTISRDTTREQSLVSVSEPESELNGPYGDFYTNVTTRKRRAKDWVSSVPVPSARCAPPRPALPPQRAPSPNNEFNTPIKSSIRQSPNSRNSKKCSFVEEPSFVADFVPESSEIYTTETPPKDNQPLSGILPAVDGMPAELVLYISALSNKLGHHDLYVTSPETEEVEIIEEMKKMVRNVEKDENQLFRELNTKTTNVLCQLVKDFFHDNEKLINGQSAMMQSLMQAVRCCNDDAIKTLLKTLGGKKQIQLAFLIRHLQSAVDAGRLPGELAGAFGDVIVSAGANNRNDPKELTEKLILIEAEFYIKMMEIAIIDEGDDQSTEYSNSENPSDDYHYSSMLGTVKTSAPPPSTPSGARWKKMIEERKHKLLANCDIKLFTSPKL
jgi:hypothetical protein